MRHAPIVLSLPTADRKRSYDFYRDGLDLEPVGDLAEDGVPEPLQFVLNDGVRLMLIPTGGFGWVTAGHATAVAGTSECLLSVEVGSAAEVRDVVEKVRAAGADVVAEPHQQPWGYVGTFADPDGHLWSVRLTG